MTLEIREIMKKCPCSRTWILLFLPAILVACASAGNTARRGTTLSEPSTSFEAVPEGWAEIAWGGLRAKLVGNGAAPPRHRAGYNGLMEIRRGAGPSPFVPAYAGLNLEHVNNGKNYSVRDLHFEPRRHPMELRRIDDHVFELYQAPLPNSGLESCARFVFKEPHTVDVTFECVPRLDRFPYGHLNLFWASYIQQPEDPAIYFLGRKKGERGERWIRALSPKHGELSTHRGSGDRRRFDHEAPFALTLVFNESQYEYTKAFYYGRYGEYVWIVMFHPDSGVRLTQSPSGGGRGNPAWDFQWFIENPEKDEIYRLRYRAVYKPWEGRDEILQLYETFLREF